MKVTILNKLGEINCRKYQKNSTGALA